jgi:hypothetical protein
MDSPFVYNKPVVGKNNIGRRTDITIFANLLAQGENVVIYEPVKTGKMSLIRQAFYNMKVSTQRFTPIEFSLLNVRTIADLMMRLGSTMIKGAGFSPEDYPKVVERYLENTHFVFDPEIYSSKDQILSLNWDINDSDIRAILALPYRIARDRSQKLYIVLSEFQNVMLTEDGTRVCKILQGIFENLQPEHRMWCSYIFTGSQVNAMKEIFEVRKLFFRRAEHLKISQLEAKEIIDHIIRGFLASGKVLDRDLMLGVCKLFRNNIWYINHFAAICDSLSKGYIMEPVLVEALDVLISIHEPRFIATMNDLTTFQICLLRAILDGYTKFSSSEVIQRYNLNSSANVKRLREALCKKEIITFDENDEPVILDPLFEYWVRKEFFEIAAE